MRSPPSVLLDPVPAAGPGVYQRSRRPTRPSVRPVLGLDIERPFGIMHGKEARVTKHDAERKVRILDFIAATLRARGYPPSVREIAQAVGLASTSAVHHHLQILEREGYLERGAAQSRAIRLTPTAAIRLGPVERARAAGHHGGLARPADHRRDRRRRPDRGLPGRVGDDGRPGHARARAATRTSSGCAATR